MLHAFHLKEIIFERIRRIEAGESQFSCSQCVWMMKRLLRSGAELVMEREQVYVRDLYPCYALFAKYYPEKEPKMRKVIGLALNPTDDFSQVKALVEELTEWIDGEVRRAYGA